MLRPEEGPEDRLVGNHDHCKRLVRRAYTVGFGLRTVVGMAKVDVDLNGEGKGKGRVDGREDKYFLEIESSFRNSKHPISPDARHMSKSEIEHVSLRQIPLRRAVARTPRTVFCQKASIVCLRTHTQTLSSPTVSLLVPQFHRYVSEASSPPSELIEFRRDHTCSIQARLLGRFGHLASRLCSAEPPAQSA